MKEAWFKKSVVQMEGYTSPPQKDFLAKLNQNENPFDVPENIKSELCKKAESLSWNRYPVNSSPELRAKLASWHHVDADQILLGSGSNQILQTLFTAVLEVGDKVLYNPPVFSLYEMFADLLNAVSIKVMHEPGKEYPIDQVVDSIEKEQPKLIVLCSPGNPTGYEMKMEDVERICSVAKGLVFFDEAYGEFTELSAILLLNKYENLIVSRTFSKAFSLAGLRFGYFLANRTIIEQLEKINIPYNVNIFTELVANRLLDDLSVMKKQVAYLTEERTRLMQHIQDIQSINVYPSSANFIMFNSSKDIDLFNELKNRGILVRNLSGYPLLKGFQRLTIEIVMKMIFLLKN